MLASKTVLGLRVDALSTWGINSESQEEPTEEEKSELGRASREMIERRLRFLEGKPIKSSLGNANMTPVAKKWEVKEARKYNKDADGLTGDEPAAKKSKSAATPDSKKQKKLVQEVEETPEADISMADVSMADTSMAADESASEGEDDENLTKAERKALKKARKAERAAKRAEKAAKKAAKEAKAAAKSEEKKRKHDDDGEKSEKKKKKKSKA